MIYEFQNQRPSLEDSSWVAPTAAVIGRVEIGAESSIWFNTVVRGDINHIKIGSKSNIQDSCTLHVTDEHAVEVGDRVTVGHGVILHGCVVEDDCLIGMGAVVLDGARIGKGSLVAAGAVVAPNTQVPPDSMVMGLPARVVRKLHDRDRKKFEKNWRNYLDLTRKYAAEEHF